jgi:hypothetical protein
VTYSIHICISGLIPDKDTIATISRTGDHRELLRGPVLYGIALTVTTLLYFREITAVLATVILCAGDGVADVAGRRYGAKWPLPWSRGKSLPGSLAFLVASYVVGLLFLHYSVAQHWTALPMNWLKMKLLVSCVLCTAVESLPFRDVDNITVTATAIIVVRHQSCRFSSPLRACICKLTKSNHRTNCSSERRPWCTINVCSRRRTALSGWLRTDEVICSNISMARIVTT